MNQKPSKKLIESIQQVVNETMSVSSTTASKVAHMGDGISLVDSPPPTRVGKIPVGKGKRVGLGWVSTPKDFKVITDIIKNAGIKIDDADDPRDVLKALNQAKHGEQKKLIDDLAKKFSTSVGRPEDAISDVKQAIIQYDKAKAEFSKHTEKIADKIHAVNKSVIEKRWKKPDLFNKDNASKYVAWDIEETGEERAQTNVGVPQWVRNQELYPKPDYSNPSGPGSAPGRWNKGPTITPIWATPNWYQGPPIPKEQGDIDAKERRLTQGDGQEAQAVGWKPPYDPSGSQFGTPDNPKPRLAIQHHWRQFMDYYNNINRKGSPREQRIANVKQIQQTKKLEKQGLFTPQSKNKVGKKLIKTAMKEHPDKGTPAFVVPEGSEQYKKLIKNMGTESGGHGAYRSTPPPSFTPPPTHDLPKEIRKMTPWHNVPTDYKPSPTDIARELERLDAEEFRKLSRRAPTGGGGGGGGGGTAVRGAGGFAGGLVIVIIAGGVAIYLAGKTASEALPDDFGNIGPSPLRTVPRYDPTRYGKPFTAPQDG